MAERPTPKPPWLKIRLGVKESYGAVRGALRSRGLCTVCEEARCPNHQECWNAGTATFLILGEICTRACAFCAVTSGRPAPPDAAEPERVAGAAAEMGLRFVVVTSVDRDDLPDRGAGHFAETVRWIRERIPGAEVEVLIPDFDGEEDLLRPVIEAGPLVIGHNTETVERLYPTVRFKHTYARSLGVLRTAVRIKRPRQVVKSGLMVGLGERDDEVEKLLRDLRDAGCEAVTIGQYLRPDRKHADVVRYVEPERFEAWRAYAESLGFLHAESGPLVRSSYRAEAIVGVLKESGRL
ncbi:MAG: lipoyl synthase [Candidatus Eisenbacteria bacterium]|nr:lipoyl synthase [Candidatus Eisenbacteria bacterium]